MSSQNLVKMANDIGRFFAAEPKRADAVAGIAAHMQRFWEPRMLRKIAVFARDSASALDELPREAVLTLKIPAVPESSSTTTVSSGAGASATGDAH